MKIEDKTAFEALSLGAATNAQYDDLIQTGDLPYGWYWTRTIAAYEVAGTAMQWWRTRII